MKTKQNWKMVMCKRKDSETWGMERAYSVTFLGEEEAQVQAEEWMRGSLHMWGNKVDYKIQDGSW